MLWASAINFLGKREIFDTVRSTHTDKQNIRSLTSLPSIDDQCHDDHSPRLHSVQHWINTLQHCNDQKRWNFRTIWTLFPWIPLKIRNLHTAMMTIFLKDHAARYHLKTTYQFHGLLKEFIFLSQHIHHTEANYFIRTSFLANGYHFMFHCCFAMRTIHLQHFWTLVEAWKDDLIYISLYIFVTMQYMNVHTQCDAHWLTCKEIIHKISEHLFESIFGQIDNAIFHQCFVIQVFGLECFPYPWIILARFSFPRQIQRHDVLRAIFVMWLIIFDVHELLRYVFPLLLIFSQLSVSEACQYGFW